MARKSEVVFACSRILSDAIMIFGGLILAYFARMSFFDFLGFIPPATLIPLGLFWQFALTITLFLLLTMAANGRYIFGTDEKFWDEFRNIFWAFSAGFSLVIVIFFFAKYEFFSRLIFGMAWVFGLVLVLIGRWITRWIRTKLWEHGVGKVRVILLGTGNVAQYVLEFLKKSPKFEVLGVLSESKSLDKTFEEEKILGTFSSFETVLKKHKPDEVILATEKEFEKTTEQLSRLAHKYHVVFRFFPDEIALDLASVEISTLGNFPLITLRATSLDGWGQIMKNIFDRTVAGISILLISPLLAFIAIRVWIEDKSAPILYRSKRVGKDGQEFFCLKFRSMIPNADELKTELMKKNERPGGVLFKMKNDPRVTSWGKFLREWSLDELPQLFNVVKGDMSLIGPRPHLPEEVAKYLPEHHPVLSIKPGLTGFAQINGRSSLSFEDEMKFELFYLKNWSLWLDIIVFVKSIWIVLNRKNVS